MRATIRVTERHMKSTVSIQWKAQLSLSDLINVCSLFFLRYYIANVYEIFLLSQRWTIIESLVTFSRASLFSKITHQKHSSPDIPVSSYEGPMKLARVENLIYAEHLIIYSEVNSTLQHEIDQMASSQFEALVENIFLAQALFSNYIVILCTVRLPPSHNRSYK